MTSDGRVLKGRYRLESKLGSGGMGSVWRARDLWLQRTVALKELVHLDRSALAERRDRAVREARALAKVSHPAIVGIHDIFFDEDDPWIVMDYIQGRSLAAIIGERNGPLSEREIAGIGLPVLQGLGAAHAAGVVHRDVKPANILVTGDDKVFLVDFGIAKISGDMTLTGHNLVLGTPEFLAPEQIHGQPVTGVTDLWSLGVTFFCALEGYSPFQRPRGRAEATPTMMAILTEDLPRLRSPGKLAHVVVRLLSKEPSDRASAPELARALESILDHQPWHHARGAAAARMPSATPPAPDNTRPTPPRPAAGPSERELRDVRETVRRAGPAAGADILLVMPEQRAAAILAGYPAEVAGGLVAAIAAARPQTAGSLLQMLSSGRAGAAVNYLTAPAAAAILAAMPVAEAVRILSHASPRTVAEVVRELPRGIAVQLVRAMPVVRAADVLRYVEPVTVAGLLTTADGPNYALLAQFSEPFRDQVKRHLAHGTVTR